MNLQSMFRVKLRNCKLQFYYIKVGCKLHGGVILMSHVLRFLQFMIFRRVVFLLEYFLDPSRHVYPRSMFQSKNKKKNVYPC